MNRSHLYKFLAVVFVVAWSLYELYPPTGRDLVEVFVEQSVWDKRDATFTNIVEKARALQKEHPERAYRNLLDAVGTNSLARYFPYLDVSNEKEPNRYILNYVQKKAAGKLRLGLDLQGGVSFLVAMDTNALGSNVVREVALENAVEVLRRRVDRLGVAEPLIQPAGSDRILIQLPGLSEDNKESARRQIEKAAFLEFRMVHPESDALLREGLIEPGYEVLTMERKLRNGQKVLERYLVKIGAERGLTGKYVKRASVQRDPVTNEPEIHFELDSEGAKIFADITREYSPKETPQGTKYYQLAIVLDGELYSAPRILGEIPGGRGRITGDFDIREAFELANVLENPLEAPVKIVQESSVDPSLGRDSIRSGLMAAIIGLALVSLFMLVYYMFAGVVANVALLLNLIILLGMLCGLEATLTLPGIAGIVLTIGMAVDANVLIYERIREELRAGKSLRGAIVAGYDKAFGTILDTNVTTIIASVILIFMGTGPVKGFGVTLTIGIAVSMFTALVVTRLIFDFCLAKGWLKQARMLSFFKDTKINFLRWALPAFVASWMLIGVGIGYGIYRGQDVLSVEFTGGDNLTLGFDKKAPVEDLRRVIGQLGVGDTLIQYQKELSTGRETLRVTTRRLSDVTEGEGASEKVLQALRQNFPDCNYHMLSLDKVGGVIGKEIQRTAIIALLLAMGGILVYVAMRYEFSFAVGAILALVHDLLMTLGWFFLTGREMGAPTIAALLTIVGFSINDTIVIFDRIREDLKLGVRGSFMDVINHANNQCLSRTVITSGTTFLTALSLYVFGGGAIDNFAFTFLVGVITGTYSSIYIASALVLWWHKGQRPTPASSVITEAAPAQTRV